MKVYLGKERQRTAQHVAAIHATGTELTMKIEGRGHNLYMDSFFPSPELFDDLVKKQTAELFDDLVKKQTAMSGRTGEACHKT